MAPLPIIIGVLFDGAELPPENAAHLRAMRLKLDQVNQHGGIEGRQVELACVAANGAHSGLPENTVAAWKKLAERREVLGIIGPAISDNALAVIDTVEEGKVPTIQWSGHELARGEWYFHFQLGHLPDEGVYLARLIAREGHTRVGVLQAGVVGEGYFEYFAREARLAGLEIVSQQLAHVHQTNVVAEMRRIQEANPHCVVFLGMSEPTLAFGRAIAELKWTIPRYANIAMASVTRSPETLAQNEGIIWTDQYEPRNPVLAKLREDYRRRYSEENETGHQPDSKRVEGGAGAGAPGPLCHGRCQCSHGFQPLGPAGHQRPRPAHISHHSERARGDLHTLRVLAG
jgi:ABC-type branched-subunit amino acid transport system substrate-binding protein